MFYESRHIALPKYLLSSGNHRVIAQRAVWANPIIGLPPTLHEYPHLPQCIEQFAIQQFIP
jgi:hypothetical protein